MPTEIREGEWSRLPTEQAGHSPHTAGLIYARDMMEESGVNGDKRHRSQCARLKGHRFLGFPFTHAQDENDTMKRKRSRFETDADDE